MEITRHFTATTMIVYHNRVLLHLHGKLNIWLPPGGHIERDELPEDAARREVSEETGLTIDFYQAHPLNSFTDAVQLLTPLCVLLEDINPYHQHIDYIYLARSHNNQIKPEDGRTRQYRWVNRLESSQLQAPENVIWLVSQALDILGEPS